MKPTSNEIYPQENRAVHFPKIKIRLRARLALSFAALGLLAAGLFAGAMYLTLRAQILDGLQTSLRQNVAIAALQIDGDAHAALTRPEDADTQTYQQLLQKVKAIQKASGDQFIIYTMRVYSG